MPAIDLSSLPSVDKLLSDSRLVALIGTHSRTAVTELVRQVISDARVAAADGNAPVPSVDRLVTLIVGRAQERLAGWPTRVINATGVILHTNLGRAPLSEKAISASSAAAVGYSDLEFDLHTGRRGSRNKQISIVIAEATGAEGGIVVNNNAAAVLLVLAALAGDGREIIVSRGEAVEIGGGFRVPDVMRQSGATLVEVGTTNKTYTADFEAAITDRTAAVLRVHPSNFTVSGFTHVPNLGELVDMCRRRNVPVLNDLGSGTLIDTERFGLAHEPMVQQSIDAGVALTMFSGDKLLGGPQAGVIAGQQQMVDRVSRHPLARALRTDKVTLAAFAATLGAYIRGVAETEIPVWRMIGADTAELRRRAVAWKDSAGVGAVAESQSAVGGGSLPGQTLHTFVLSIEPAAGADAFVRDLRSHSPPVAARIEDDKVILDPRTVDPDEDAAVIGAIRSAFG